MYQRTLPEAEIRKLPYLDRLPDDGRIVELRSFYDHDKGDWYLFHIVREGELGRIAGGQVVSGSYFSSYPVDSAKDFPFQVSSIVAKHLSFPGVSNITNRLESDLHQMAAVLGKYHWILKTDDLNDAQRRALLETELEYTVGLCRAFFDLLQKLACDLGATVRPLDALQGRSFKDLPESFAKVAIDRSDVRDPQQIVKRWGLFPRLAEFYARYGPWFGLLRQARDGIFHHGKTSPSVLLLDEGAAVSIREAPWREFPFWDETNVIRDDWGSARALLAHLFTCSIQASQDFMDAFLTHIKVPASIGEAMNVFVRGEFSYHLLRLASYEQSPWEGRDSS